jgi:hypothetical protein
MGDWMRHTHRVQPRRLVGAVVVVILLLTLALLVDRW